MSLRIVQSWEWEEIPREKVDWGAGHIINGPREEDKFSIEANWEAVIDAVSRWQSQQSNAEAYAARALAASNPTITHEASPTPPKEPLLAAPASDEDGAATGGPSLRFRFDYDESDAPLVEEIAASVKAGRFRSIWQGSVELAQRAKGSGKGDSKAHRLARKVKALLISQGWTGSDSADPS